MCTGPLSQPASILEAATVRRGRACQRAGGGVRKRRPAWAGAATRLGRESLPNLLLGRHTPADGSSTRAAQAATHMNPWGGDAVDVGWREAPRPSMESGA
ncbi:hypothetical protein VPH35_080986 [Triticum aestivum]|uniref:Uncharacterized protein n=1 Tax=Triticum urartu TaxID=4572 RepID=A0A8R7QA17_TRIUA